MWGVVVESRCAGEGTDEESQSSKELSPTSHTEEKRSCLRCACAAGRCVGRQEAK